MIVSGKSDRALVLHSRPYSDTRRLLDLLTREHGRVTGMYRKGFKTVEPFVHYEILWRGQNDLVTITQLETKTTYSLSGKNLYSGMYLNELIMKTTRPNQRFEGLFDVYVSTIGSLATRDDLEPPLRSFERVLLKSLGVDLQFDKEMTNGRPIEPTESYSYVRDHGFKLVDSMVLNAIKGETLLAIADDDYSAKETRQVAKFVLRSAIQDFMGDSELVSRRLFLESVSV